MVDFEYLNTDSYFKNANIAIKIIALNGYPRRPCLTVHFYDAA